MSDPSLKAHQLNIRLIPKSLLGLPQERQNTILRQDSSLRDELIRLLCNFKYTIDTASRVGGMLL